MKPLNWLLDMSRNVVRSFMTKLARVLNVLSRGHLTPNMVTLTSFVAHVPIAYLISQNKLFPAAILLVVFGLLDSLDGALARLQKRASSAGMLLDASTDRMKEVLLYTGVAYALASGSSPETAVWAVAACGASLSVSYVKAKGETAISKEKLTPNEINRLFADGLMRYEVRMFLLVVGLLSNNLLEAIVLIAVLSTFTALSRLMRIYRKLA